MKNLTAQVSSVAMLALAALPIASLPASALAAPASVKIADLDLLTPEGMSTFQKRADHAARDFCRQEKSLSVAALCRVAVKDELNDKVAGVRAARLQASTTFAAR